MKKHVPTWIGFIFILPLCLLTVSGCKEKEILQSGNPDFKLDSPSEITVGAEGSDISVNLIITNPAQDGYVDILCDEDWIGCPQTVETDVAVISVAPNNLATARNGNVVFTYRYQDGSIEQSVRILQDGTSESAGTVSEANYFKGIYNGTIEATSSGHFTIYINTAGKDPDEGYSPQCSYLKLEVYTRKQTDPREARIPAGQYTYNGEEDENPGCISGLYSNLIITDETGDIFGEYQLSQVSMDVTETSDGNFRYDLVITTDDDVTRSFVYEGPASFEDESGEPIPLTPVMNDIATVLTGASGTFYSKDGTGVSNVFLQFYDMDRNIDGLLIPPGNLLSLDLYCTLDSRGMIASGKYKADYTLSGSDFTYTAGFTLDYFGTLIPGGSYVTAADAVPNLSYGFLTEGDVTVSEDGGIYDITFDLTMEGGYKFSASYSGSILIENMDDGDDSDDDDPQTYYYSTLEDDVTVDFEPGAVTAKAGYFGQYYSELTSNWIINILPDGSGIEKEGIHIEFCDTYAEYDGTIPEGTYTGKYTYEPDSFVPGYMVDQVLQGTWYVKYDDSGNIVGYAPAMEGTVDVKNNGNGTYTISFSCYDDAETPHNFSGTWTGEITVSDETELASTSVRNSCSYNYISHPKSAGRHRTLGIANAVMR